MKMAKYQIEIVDTVIKKLKGLKNGAKGTLLTSTECDEGFTVLGFCLANIGGDDNRLSDSAEIHPIAGVVYLGSFYVSADELKAMDILTIKVDPETQEISALHETLGRIDMVIVTDAQVAKKYFIVRSQMVAPFSCELTEEGITTAIENFKEKFDEVGFAEFKDIALDKPFITRQCKKVYHSMQDIEIVELTTYMKASPSSDNEEPAKAMLIDYKNRSAKCCWFDLPLDTLTLVPRHEPALYILDMVSLSFRRCLSLVRDCLLSQLQDIDTMSTPETFHFLPESLSHFISIVYAKKKLDRDLGEFRRALHEAFVLPTDRPLLMRGNAFAFRAAEAGQELLNPHEAVSASGVVGGEPATVQGRYAYHHYCQQGEDDDGWGCAYRSLQTLASWFKLQGYTNRTVPKIKEIQQCLVDIGDKPAKFVGSREWIGSTEVGFCLDTMLGVSSRISFVSGGEEMSMKGGELTHHFKTQGTPVMIGGGNLAHTILGVDYNKKTGNIKFLVLDPHYTGREDLNVIISKGWCGWKELSFWKKGCFYNMCMPIRPKCI